MKRLTVALLVVASACSSPRRDDDHPETYEPFWQVRDHGQMSITLPDESGGLHYAVLCEDEKAIIAGWSGSLGEIRSTAQAHRSETEWHRTAILWRQAGQTRTDPHFGYGNEGAHEDAHDDIPIHPRR